MYGNDLPTRTSGEASDAGTQAAFRPSGESTARIAQRLSSNAIAMLQTYVILGKEAAQRTVRGMVVGALFVAVAAVLGIYVLSLVLATGILALSTVMRPWVARSLCCSSRRLPWPSLPFWVCDVSSLRR